MRANSNCGLHTKTVIFFAGKLNFDKPMLFLFCLLFASAIADTHIDKKVSVKEVVFDSPVSDLLWCEPDDRVVLARTSNGMHT
jgi:hypothetical protein